MDSHNDSLMLSTLQGLSKQVGVLNTQMAIVSLQIEDLKETREDRKKEKETHSKRLWQVTFLVITLTLSSGWMADTIKAALLREDSSKSKGNNQGN